MSKRYTGNAIYSAIEQSPKKENFLWVAGDAWLLAYADKNLDPRVLAYVKMVNGDPTKYASTEKDVQLRRMLRALAEPVGIPDFEILIDQSKPLDTVVLSIREGPHSVVNLSKLADTFASSGLPRNPDDKVKPINKASSSAYHDWQREYLGGDITVSDIDLIRHRSGTALEVVELKRSYRSIDEWEPYPVDFPNFKVIWKLTRASELKFTIVYNRRQTKPAFFDDPSMVAIFPLDFSKSPPWARMGSFSFDHFLLGKYLS